VAIEIDDRVALSLQKLQRQADDLAMPLHEYLDLLAEIASLEPNMPGMSEEEFDAVLAEIDQLPPAPGSLPDDFSRADIYIDHD
jgi:hypothetical protein